MKHSFHLFIFFLVLLVLIYSFFILSNKEQNIDYIPPVVGESHSDSGLNLYLYPSKKYVEQMHEEGMSDEDIAQVWDKAHKNNRSIKSLIGL